MFKKFFLFLFLSCLFFSKLFAQPLPSQDPNLVLFYQHQGLQNFLLKNSIHSHYHNSLRVISFDFLTFDSIQPDNTDWLHVESMQFAFDESSRKVFFFDHNGNLDFLDPYGSIAQGSGYAQGAEIVYFLATRHKFYGSFDDNFYSNLALIAGAPSLLHNNNFILYADLGSHDVALYVDRLSCKLISSSPCIISIDEVQIPNAAAGSTSVANRFSHLFKFDSIHQRAFSFEPSSNSWRLLDPYISNPEDDDFTYDVAIAEIAFFLYFHQKFFHSFPDSFYSLL